MLRRKTPGEIRVTSNTPKISLVDVDSIRVEERLRPRGDITALVQSIASLGLLNPITLAEDFRLIAGHNRLAAFKELGRKEIPAIVLRLSEVETKLAEIDENLIRNELTLLDRAEHYHYRKQLYEALFPETRRGGRRGNQHTGGIRRQNDKLSFSQDAARKTIQSGRSIQRLIEIARKLTSETKALLRNSPIANSKMELLRLSKVPSAVQEEVAQVLAQNRGWTVTEARALVERRRRLATPCPLPLEGQDYRLIRGSLSDRGKDVESESVSLILTDPPYFKNCLGVFSELSAFAARVLKPGGSLVTMVGAYFLPEILARLSEQLDYHWVINCIMNGGNRYIESRRVRVASKPFVWFVKGKYFGQTIRDVMTSGGPDKRFHPWGQAESEFAFMVECFTQPNDLIVDPFLGGGVSAVAALRLGRRFIGIDSALESVEMSRRRIEEVQTFEVPPSVTDSQILTVGATH
jgi:hypothetical protein